MPHPTPNPAPGAVLLSYAREDTAAARQIADALRAAGVEVWFDQNELRGGDAWDQKIRTQIKECALFVPVISANTQARRGGPHSGYPSSSLNPILRTTSPVGHGKNPNGFVHDSVGEVIREDAEIHASITPRTNWRDQRMLPNPCDCRTRLILQSQTQPRLYFLVAGNRVGQLSLGFRQNLDVHRPNRRSRSAKTSSALRERASPFSTACSRRTISSSQTASTSGAYS